MKSEQVIKIMENKLAALKGERDAVFASGELERVLRLDAEMAETSAAINQFRASIGQEVVPVERPHLDALVAEVAEILKPENLVSQVAEQVAEILRPTAETVPDQLKATITQTAELLDTILEGDGLTFFGKGLTNEKREEVKLIRDELTKQIEPS